MSRESGFTLIELSLGMLVMLVALSVFSGTVLSTTRQRAISRETALAAQAVRSVFESMRNEDFSEVLRLYDSDAANDPAGVGSAPGAEFDVPGLEPLPGGLPGQVIFPLVEVGSEDDPRWELREDFANVRLGMPRDLDGDGAVDALDHSADTLILPVLIRVEWMSNAGPRLHEQYTMLVGYVH